MIKRNLLKELKLWAATKNRKPMVLRGARQTGKTTLVSDFSKYFEQYIYLNLEMKEDRKAFEEYENLETLVQTLFFQKGKLLSAKANTLIFIDEIQEIPEALNILRYFYEEAPEIPVIAAGSMLESIFDPEISFPVGRVEYKVLHPVSFDEFLGALGEQSALEQFHTIPTAKFAHSKLMKLFHTYALIGGMPEVMSNYLQNKDTVALGKIYDSLINSYLEDVEKYAKSNAQANHIRHVIRNSFSVAGKRIKFERFGNSPYGSREIAEAFRVLEKALLLNLIFPITDTILPMTPDIKKSPRLQLLDSGLINYFLGIQSDIMSTKDLNSIYQGTLIEHLVGQEILAPQFNALSSLNFWVREKNSSMAEVDYIIPFNGKLIPVEVKSGKAGKLKSLHQFMDAAPHSIAVRLYAGEMTVEEIQTPKGKKFHLLSLPYYLSSKITDYLKWLLEEE